MNASEHNILQQNRENKHKSPMATSKKKVGRILYGHQDMDMPHLFIMDLFTLYVPNLVLSSSQMPRTLYVEHQILP